MSDPPIKRQPRPPRKSAYWSERCSQRHRRSAGENQSGQLRDTCLWKRGSPQTSQPFQPLRSTSAIHVRCVRIHLPTRGRVTLERLKGVSVSAADKRRLRRSVVVHSPPAFTPYPAGVSRGALPRLPCAAPSCPWADYLETRRYHRRESPRSFPAARCSVRLSQNGYVPASRYAALKRSFRQSCQAFQRETPEPARRGNE